MALQPGGVIIEGEDAESDDEDEPSIGLGGIAIGIGAAPVTAASSVWTVRCMHKLYT